MTPAEIERLLADLSTPERERLARAIVETLSSGDTGVLKRALQALEAARR